MKKLALGIATVLMLFTMMTTPAQARWWHHGWGWGAYPVSYGCGGACDYGYGGYPVSYGYGYGAYPAAYGYGYGYGYPSYGGGLLNLQIGANPYYGGYWY